MVHVIDIKADTVLAYCAFKRRFGSVPLQSHRIQQSELNIEFQSGLMLN